MERTKGKTTRWWKTRGGKTEGRGQDKEYRREEDRREMAGLRHSRDEGRRERT